MSWIGIDLDGTLAEYDKWRGIEHIGEPIENVHRFTLELLKRHVEVRIVTARCQEGPEAIGYIEDWCLKHLGQVIPVTDRKDMNMVLLIDDRVLNPKFTPLPHPEVLAKKVAKHWDDPIAPPKELSRAIPQADGDGR